VVSQAFWVAPLTSAGVLALLAAGCAFRLRLFDRARPRRVPLDDEGAEEPEDDPRPHSRRPRLRPRPPPRAPSAAESSWELRSQISDLEQQRDEALQMNAALARRVVLERVEADRAAAAAAAGTWSSQDPEGYVI